ncbi:hypothetical protein IWW38_002501 [Coemansia aciculifera]|uniref:Uncharacterized protein n=1 Tax=Coemansia aciculifera TaxID=417176 RepID=A0ACC1M318_9FUNG|nr:hypothetical protein IWW38_002501 [Coemansia aciculifera]
MSDELTTLYNLPGIGAAEMTEGENELAIRLGHATDWLSRAQDELSQPAQEKQLEIPEATGVYRIIQHDMVDSEMPYAIDNPDIQAKFAKLHSLDKRGQLEGGHSFVVASSAKLGLDGDILADSPLTANEKIALYINGGGFIVSDMPILKWFYIRLSMEVGRRVFVPRYSVGLNHPFPRALYDVHTTYSYLIHRGFSPGNIVLIGTSSGGNLAMSLLLLLDMLQQPTVARCILISPYLDMTMSFASWQRNLNKCVVLFVPTSSPTSLPRVYYGPTDMSDSDIALQLKHPLLSPIFGNLKDLPPIQVHVGEDEVLLDDAVELVKRVKCVHPPSRSGSSLAPIKLVTYLGKNHYSILRGKTQLDMLYHQMREFCDAV